MGEYAKNSQVLFDSYNEQERHAQSSLDNLNKTIEATAKLNEIYKEYDDTLSQINLSDALDQAGVDEFYKGKIIGALHSELGLEDALKFLDGNWFLDFNALEQEDKIAIEKYFDSILATYESEISSTAQ
nr:hypothetical protein [Treponema sp.]